MKRFEIKKDKRIRINHFVASYRWLTSLRLKSTGLLIKLENMKLSKRKKKIDYRMFVILGVSLFVLGISLMSSFGPIFVSFIGCGVVFTIIGLKKSDKRTTKKRK